ncbi:MAG: 4-hydroxybenzoate octaprenyltransferase [Alphaproteobacteria bacterium]|nr:4-hydroxybenzoate octaprenyltransferase [Alphaproteobacteria bacterium]
MRISDIINITRINSPAGALLLFWPCAYACTISSNEVNFFLILKFFVASFLARSAGCIINDIMDRDIDAKVERTKNRPLANRSITLAQALTVLAIICILGLCILLSMNGNAVAFFFLTAPLVGLYPLAKRFTNFPQVFLGITFNSGVLVAAIHNENFISFKILLLYLGCIFWTIAYDTIYGYMDLNDDKKIGVKSLSIFLEDKNPRLWIMIFYSLFLLFFYLSVYCSKQSLNLLQIVLGVFALCYFVSQISELEMNSNAICLRSFKANNIIAFILFIVTIV